MPPFASAVTVSLVPEAKGGPFVFWDGLSDGCARAAEIGFDAVEVFPPSADDLDAYQLKHLLEQHRLKLAAVGTGAGWVVQKLRLTDPDATIRGRARHFVSAIVDLAGKLGAPAIIGSMQGRVEAGVTRAQSLAWMAEALEQLGPRAHVYGVPLLLEPLNRYETNLFNTVDDTVSYLSSLRTRNVKLLCDCFHMNIEEVSIADSLRRAGSSVGHVHLADSNRQAAGLGHTDFGAVAQALQDIGYAGYLSAEVLPLPDSIAAARQTIAAIRQLNQAIPSQ
ncbi:MAG: sugar phosphate isomerase/epimerase [Verrucomicrobiales bacterium]|nr:sugar phosphate isomerase/epimerase [Verrucomicrobiales bacterium]